MTRLYTSGFEWGVSSMSVNGGGIANYIAGSPTVQSTVKRSGEYAARAYASGTAAQVVFIIPSYGSGTQSNVVARFYFRWHTAPTSAIRIMRWIVDAGSAPAIYFDPADNKIYPYLGTAGSKTAALTVDTWYRIDIKLTANGTTTTFDLQLDGSAVTQKTLSQAALYFNALYFGIYDSNTAEFFYDDVEVDNDTSVYPIGEGFVLGYSPNEDGTHNAGTNVIEDQSGNDIGAVTAYNLVDEVPMSTTTDYVRQYATGTGNYAEVKFTDTTQSSPKSARGVLAYDASGTTADTGGCVIIDEDSTVTTVWGGAGSSLADYSESSLFYKSVQLPTPSGGWDAAAVNALKARVGYSDNVATYPYWHSLMVEVGFSGTYSSSVALVVQDCQHTHTAGAIVLEPKLVISDCQHSHSAGAIVLEPKLVIDNCAHVQAAGSPSLEVKLSVADATHLQTAGGITLEPKLTVADSSHGMKSGYVQTQTQPLGLLLLFGQTAQSLVDIPLTQHGGALAPDDATHLHTADNPSLTQHQVISVSNAVHNQQADNCSLVINLQISDSTHLHNPDNITLTQHQILSVDNSTHLQTAQEISLTQHQILSVENGSQLQTADEIALIQHHVLSLGDSTHLQTAENITLTVPAILLIIQGTTHVLKSGYLATVSQPLGLLLLFNQLSQTLTDILLTAYEPAGLVVSDGIHLQTAQNIDLIQHQSLAVQDATHLQTSGNVDLTQHQVLAVDSPGQVHAAENITLVYTPPPGVLEVQDCTHVQVTESPNLTQHQVLVVADSTHTHNASEIVILGVDCVPGNASHGHSADEIVLVYHPHYDLVMDDCQHLHLADNLDLVQHHLLVIGSTTQEQIAQNVNLGGIDIYAQDAIQVHTADNIDLVQHHVLVVANSSHLQTADNIVLSTLITLAVQDSIHYQTSNEIVLVYVALLIIANAVHYQTAESVGIYTVVNLRMMMNRTHLVVRHDRVDRRVQDTRDDYLEVT